MPIVQKIVIEPSEANIIQSYNLEEQPFLFPELEEKFFNLSEEIDNNATSKESKTYNNEKTSLGESLEKRDLDLNQFSAGQSPTTYVFNLSTSQRLSLVRRHGSIITDLQNLQSTLSA
jgi:hypothetical protein